MQLGMVGLGRMGANMVRRLMRGGHACFVFDLNAESVRQIEGEGAGGAQSIEDLVGNSTVWSRSSKPWRQDAARSNARRAARKRMALQKTVICIAAPPAPDISSG